MSSQPGRGRRRRSQGLHELDEVAYLLFASVSWAFGSADDFEREMPILPLEGATQPTVV